MENLVTAIVWFGNTVVICIAAIVIYCMVNQGGEQMIFFELALWLIGVIVVFYGIAHMWIWFRNEFMNGGIE